MIYLASRSPRRLALLEQIGITDVRLLLDEDEARAEALEAVRPKESPTQYVERVARAKGEAAWARLMALRDRPVRPMPGRLRRCWRPTRRWPWAERFWASRKMPATRPAYWACCRGARTGC